LIPERSHSEWLLGIGVEVFRGVQLADCIICDASRTGCRISCETLSELPNDLHIEIPGLTGPVLALMVWRKDNMAGMEFLWETEIYMLDDTPAS
jgi:hypothetical protein